MFIYNLNEMKVLWIIMIETVFDIFNLHWSKVIAHLFLFRLKSEFNLNCFLVIELIKTISFFKCQLRWIKTQITEINYYCYLTFGYKINTIIYFLHNDIFY